MPSQLVCTQYHRLPGQSVHGRRLRHAERNRLCVAQRVNYEAGHLKEHLGLQACERVRNIRVHAGIGIVEIGLVLVLGLKLHGDAIATCTTLFFVTERPFLGSIEWQPQNIPSPESLQRPWLLRSQDLLPLRTRSLLKVNSNSRQRL